MPCHGCVALALYSFSLPHTPPPAKGKKASVVEAFEETVSLAAVSNREDALPFSVGAGSGAGSGSAAGCFTAGIFDMTGAVAWGKENVLVVRLGVAEDLEAGVEAGLQLADQLHAIILVGIIATFAAFFLTTGFNGYLNSKNTNEGAINAQMALDITGKIGCRSIPVGAVFL